MLIQMPILFALYRVIYAIPAYVGRVKEAFFPLVDNIIDTAGATELVQNLSNSAMYSKQFTNSGFVAGTHSEYVQNTIIDCLNKASTADFASISEKFPSLAADVTNTVSKLEEYNNFLGLNIGNSPSYVLKEAWANGAWLLVIGAIAIPVLSALTQWINVKLMPQQDTSSNNGNDQAAAMASSMKTMNMIMPLMSAWFCFTLPSGLGLYWVAGSVVRSIQQIVINKHIDKMDFDDIIRKNSAKSAKKLEKMKEQQDKLNAYASMSTKNIQKKANISSNVDNSEVSADSYSEVKEAKPGSMMAKANMVRDYNEKNSRK